MAWTTPVDQTTGHLITAAEYNAQIIDNLKYLHGDAGTVIDLTAGGQALRAKTLQLDAASDTVFSRSAAAQATLGNGSGNGNLLSGYTTASVAIPGTYVPDAARLVNRVVATTAAGTLTIGAPANTPSANFSGFILVLIQNSSGGTVSFSWNAAYVNAGLLPASEATGSGYALLFAWDGAISKWLPVSTAGISTGV